MAHGLFQPDAPVDECIGLAMDHMRNNSKMMKNQLDELEAREGTVTQMVTVTLEQLRPLGVPEEAPRGEKISMRFGSRFSFVKGKPLTQSDTSISGIRNSAQTEPSLT